jgi:hypothetical protein
MTKRIWLYAGLGLYAFCVVFLPVTVGALSWASEPTDRHWKQGTEVAQVLEEDHPQFIAAYMKGAYDAFTVAMWDMEQASKEVGVPMERTITTAEGKVAAKRLKRVGGIPKKWCKPLKEKKE